MPNAKWGKRILLVCFSAFIAFLLAEGLTRAEIHSINSTILTQVYLPDAFQGFNSN